MAITSRCVECGASSIEGSLTHAVQCTASALKPTVGHGMRLPALQLEFSDDKERQAFMKKLGAPRGAVMLPSEHPAPAKASSTAFQTRLEETLVTLATKVAKNSANRTQEHFSPVIAIGSAELDHAATQVTEALRETIQACKPEKDTRIWPAKGVDKSIQVGFNAGLDQFETALLEAIGGGTDGTRS